MRRSIENVWLKLIRLYTFNAPIRKGKYRIFQSALNLCRYRPQKDTVLTSDGRLFEVDFTDGMYNTVFFLGEYERIITEIVKLIIAKGDVCFDVGANVGWYTTLLHNLCSGNAETKSGGGVHAFEPLPDVFAQLQRNWALAGKPQNVFLNNFALGDENRAAHIHRFANEPSGHSSLAIDNRRNVETIKTRLVTLDAYLEERRIKNVDFVKVDVEGAELMFLRGAQRLFEQPHPPIFIIEMALSTTKGFGYLPNDLIEYLRSRADYKFYAINEIRGVLKEINGFAREDVGANVLCLPPNRSPQQIGRLKFV